MARIVGDAHVPPTATRPDPVRAGSAVVAVQMTLTFADGTTATADIGGAALMHTLRGTQHEHGHPLIADVQSALRGELRHEPSLEVYAAALDLVEKAMTTVQDGGSRTHWARTSRTQRARLFRGACRRLTAKLYADDTQEG